MSTTSAIAAIPAVGSGLAGGAVAVAATMATTAEPVSIIAVLVGILTGVLTKMSLAVERQVRATHRVDRSTQAVHGELKLMRAEMKSLPTVVAEVIKKPNPPNQPSP